MLIPAHVKRKHASERTRLGRFPLGDLSTSFPLLRWLLNSSVSLEKFLNWRSGGDQSQLELLTFLSLKEREKS